MSRPAHTSVRGLGVVGPEPWSRSAADLAEELGTDPVAGLRSDEADRRREAGGANRLPALARRSPWARFVAQFRSLLVGVLVAAAGLALLIGEPVDAAVIAAVLLLNAAMGYLQERRAERSIATLEGLLATRAQVRRDGRLIEVDAGELVPGDVVSLGAGDRVPADGRWWSTTGLAVDESSLTGESVPVDKDADAVVPADVPVGDRTTMGWTNTTVTRGRGWLLVTATGEQTQLGGIAVLLSEASPRPTPLQRQLDVLGRRMVALAVVAVLTVFALAMLRGDELGDAALDAIALAVAAIPEGLPAVVTLTLALGGAAMARHRAIVRRLTSVETLGSTSVICTDKTGTLTYNEMTATVLWRAGREHRVTGVGYSSDGKITPPPGAMARPVGVMVRCNDAELVDGCVVGDPTEGALLTLATKVGADLTELRAVPRLAELPFDATSKLMATSHLDERGGLVVEVKGAPDVLLNRCRSWIGPLGEVPLDPEACRSLLGVTDELAGRGLRCLALAIRRLDAAVEERIPPLEDLLEGLTFEAIVGIVDPPRPGVAAAIATSHRAGIRVIMITGDHPATAGSIAEQLDIPGELVTGTDLDRLDDRTLAARIDRIGVCARVAPAHKVRIVHALQARGSVVAMTGDGVNDAPALEHADIGIAMGVTGTELTREAADLVLADDDFSTIVTAVERGRVIYDNIVAFIRFQLATNLGAITTVLVARLAGLPAPFTAIQLLWVNIIMDGPPALALGVDPARRDTMHRPPRGDHSQLLDPARIVRVALASVTMAAGTLAVYATALDGTTVAVATSWAFTTFVLFQVANALNARSERTTVLARHTFTNPHLWAALAGVVALQIAAVHLPLVGGVLDTVALSPRQWLLAAAIASSVVLVEELRKAVARRRSEGR
jgi:P-type Ca2+ transporter type 2C